MMETLANSAIEWEMAMIVRRSISFETAAELIERLGGIPPERILMNPTPGQATETDLIEVLSEPLGRSCELVDGVLVEKAMGAPESLLALFIGRMLGVYAAENDLGVVLGADGPYQLGFSNVRLPDVSFIPWSRLPEDELPDDAISKVIPTLTVEVLSPKNTRAEIDRKLEQYFGAGVKLAWVIDHRGKSAKVYTSPKRFKELDATGTLDGGKVLPGFKLPLAELFAATKRRKKKPR